MIIGPVDPGQVTDVTGIRLPPLVGLEPVQPAPAPAELVARLVRAPARPRPHRREAAGQPPLRHCRAVGMVIDHPGLLLGMTPSSLIQSQNLCCTDSYLYIS